MKFIDEAQIVVGSGKGGAGAVSFRREAMVPRGGPDGGDGGDGGDLIFRVDSRLHSLLDFKFKRSYLAEDGEPGQRRNRAGRDGKPMVLSVPPGTLVRDLNGQILLDLNEQGDVVFLKGGLGGKGNPFYKSSVNQAPGVSQHGLPGQQREVRLELKLIADVGLIGLPNAGKSSLIAAISAARPKIADYPFTTLTPNLGVVRYGDERTFVVADVPGLIQGAAEGAGLGTQFLRHIERTKLLVHLVDVSALSENHLAQYQMIREELRRHDESKESEPDYVPLSSRPEIVALNKIDTLTPDEQAKILAAFDAQTSSVPLMISAVSHKNLKELVLEIGKHLFQK